MNNEIKEILAYFEKYVKITYMHDSEPMLNWKELKLLDYITNLQQENQELNDSITWWNNRFNAVQRDYEDYKSRIEKAVEELKLWKPKNKVIQLEIELLLDILRGKDNE